LSWVKKEERGVLVRAESQETSGEKTGNAKEQNAVRKPKRERMGKKKNRRN